MGERLRVAVVDDDPIFAELVCRVLEREATVVGTATSPAAALELAAGTQPDALLLDVILGNDNAVDLVPDLVRTAPRTMIAAMTGLDATQWEGQLLRVGTFVFYEKTVVAALPQLLSDDVALFRRALSGEDIVAPSALRRRPSVQVPTTEEEKDSGVARKDSGVARSGDEDPSA